MSDVSALYEQDYYLWLQETYQRLEKKEIDQLDWPHLMEEILSLGNEQRRKVDSYLRQLLIHLLLYQYWESERERCAKSWQNEIDNFRFELELLLKSQTLYNYFLQEIEEIYVKARKQAIKKSELPPDLFPEKCLFTAADLLDSDFLP
jgi:hypothetical protein